MRYFLIIPVLVGLICAGTLATAKEKKSKSTPPPALTGEPTPKVVPPAAESISPAATNSSPISTKESSQAAKPASDTPVPVTESRVAALVPEDLKEFADQPEAVKRLISTGLILTSLNLSYQYGSADPKNGGMDCSGTVYYLLTQMGLHDVPRDSSGMYKWVWKEGHFQSVISSSADTFELDRLKPGDLLFWTGTYHVDHDPPVTHVMIYLGINRHTDHRVMLGASEGRPYEGKSRYGVSVFDFKLTGLNRKQETAPTGSPKPTSLEPRFIGYGSVPHLEEASSSDGLKQ